MMKGNIKKYRNTYGSKTEGITLMTLAITIVILLILAGVTITTVWENDGIQKGIKEEQEKSQNLINEELKSIDDLAQEVYSKLGDAPKDAVAKMNNQYYTTLQGAIDVAPTDNKRAVIFLLKDTSEDIQIEKNKNIVLYLEEHTIMNESETSYTIQNNGKITIIGGMITSENYGTIQNTKEGNLIVKRGSIISETSNAIQNYGTLEIGGTADIRANATVSTIYNQATGNLTITGGTITNTTSGYGAYNNGGTVSYTGGTISKHNFG